MHEEQFRLKKNQVYRFRVAGPAQIEFVRMAGGMFMARVSNPVMNKAVKSATKKKDERCDD